MRLGALVYIEKDEHVLMIHREKDDEHRSLWLAPGGKIEKNEAPYEAAVREAKEETGLDCFNLELKGVVTFPDEGDSPFGDEWTVFVFYTSEFKGELTTDCPEGRLEWIHRDQLQDLPMWEGDHLFTPKIFEEGCFTSKMLYQGRDMTACTFWP